MQVAGEITIAPHLFIRQTRTTGGMHHHLFVLGDRSVLTVQQQGYHYQWGHLGQSWHKPLVVAHPPALLPADATASLVQQALQHNAAAVSQMSPWQKLLWAAMEGCKMKNLGGAIWQDVIKPLLSWESAAILLGIVVLCAIPYVGEVVLVLLMGASIYHMVTQVVGLFKQYYEAAIHATSYEGLQQAARYFSSAVIGGLLDVLGIVAGGGALARIRLLRAQGRLTVGAWLEAMAEWGQSLMRRVQNGGRMLDRLWREAITRKKKASQPRPTQKWKDDDGNILWPPNDGFAGAPVPVTLKPGTMIDRYGYDGGTFVSPVGQSYKGRSLAPGTENKPYSVFEVVKPIEATGGKAAPWFDQPGGATQYKLNKSIDELIKDGSIRVVSRKPNK